ncbi:MAG: M23 family metallopeptidase [Vicingaceae bacterium]
MRLIIAFPIILTFLFTALNFSSTAQVQAQTKEFTSPLDVPLYLAGSFAELRNNHFHSGLDIKTQGREGLNVRSVASGYVSRIKISPFGYGRVVYVRHPNGYTSVYAHLQKFNDEIEKAVKSYQYANKKFAVEMYPSASRFPIKQGDLIGISGNSGSSSAPHLHFELRETKSEAPVNPLLFGFDISDDISPEIIAVYVYPREDLAQVNGTYKKVKSKVIKSQNDYRLHDSEPIKVSGKIALGLQVFDRLNEVPNKCGIYEIDLYRNGDLIFQQRMDKFEFHETRYMNSMVDYEERMKNKTWIYCTFVRPNNRLKIYPKKIGDGIIEIRPGIIENFRYKIRDSYGNESILDFQLQGSEPSRSDQGVIRQMPEEYFRCDQANSLEKEDIMIYLPANILYEDLAFKFWKGDTLPRSFTPLYHIHDWYTPLQSYMALSIKVKDMPLDIRKFATIVSKDKNGGIVPEGGYWKGDYIIVKTRSFGPYTVMIDSVKPKLTKVNVPPSGDMRGKWSIIIKAEDNLSGVFKYDAYIDGKWALQEFDYKKKQLIHYFEEGLTPGEHTYKVVVRDKIGNKNELIFNFTR